MTEFDQAHALLSALYSQLDPASASLDHDIDLETGEHVVRLEVRSSDLDSDVAPTDDRGTRRKMSLLRHLAATT